MTLTKLAKLANVSVSTASKAFSMSSEVNEETRKIIFDIAKEHGCFKKYYNANYPKLVIAIVSQVLRATTAKAVSEWRMLSSTRLTAWNMKKHSTTQQN